MCKLVYIDHKKNGAKDTTNPEKVTRRERILAKSQGKMLERAAKLSPCRH
jgi:hypothetical protein